MSKKPLSLIIGALLASGICLAEDAKTTAPAGNATIATVNGVTYPLDQFRAFFTERLEETQAKNDTAFQQQTFNEFMTMIVAAQEAQKRKLQDKPEVAAALEVQRMKVMSNAALGDMAQGIKITDDELKTLYEEAKKTAVGTEYKARHILVKDEATAKKLIKDLEKKDADFGELAKKNSEVSTAKTDGGALDWFDANTMPKPFAEAVAKLKPGSISKEPVQTQFGWHVIQLQETRTAEPPSFEDAKPQLESILQRQKLSLELDKLKNAAKVELNEDVVKLKKEDAAAADKSDEAKK